MRTLAIALLMLGVGAPGAPAAAQPQRATVTVVQVSGLIDPVTADFVAGQVRTSRQSEVVVMQLNSPGAVVSRARLARLERAVQSSSVPIAVWVGPTGARAAGGAARLVAAAAITGTAPGAHSAQRGVLRAPTLGDFIVGLDGRDVGGRTLATARVVDRGGAPRREPDVNVRFAKLGLIDRVLHTAASPPVAYVLFVIGLVLVALEFFTAGIGVSAAVGAACLLLAGYGLGVLPVTAVGIVLVLVAIAGFSIDVQAGAPRSWTVIGAVCLVVGSVLFYGHAPGAPGRLLSWAPLVLTLAGVIVFMVGGLPAMVRARFATPTIGRESMIGEVGQSAARLDPDGTVTVRGAPWRARTNRATPIDPGQAVRVVGIEGVVLEVEPRDDAASG